MSEAPVRTEDQPAVPEALKLSEMLERGLIPGMDSSDLPLLRKWSTRYLDFPQPIGWRAPANLYSLAEVVAYAQKRRGKGTAVLTPVPAVPDVEPIPAPRVAPDEAVSNVPPGCEPSGRWLPLAEHGYSKYKVWSAGGQGRDQRPVRSVDRINSAGRQVAGQILSIAEGTQRRSVTRRGYLQVKVYNDEGKQETKTVHSLILLANVGPPPEGMQTRHLDGEPWNNRWEPGDEETTRKAGGNLIYGTGPEQHKDQVAAGTFTRPEYPCAGGCGGTAPFATARCRPCMTTAGQRAAALLNEGVPLPEATRRCGYRSESWTFAAARDFGGYQGTTAQARHPRKKPLLRRVLGRFRRGGRK